MFGKYFLIPLVLAEPSVEDKWPKYSTTRLMLVSAQLSDITFSISSSLSTVFFQCWTNINIWTEYEYEYIRVSKFHRIRIWIYSGFKLLPNTNMNIFGFQIFTEYEYEFIRVSNFHRIRIYSSSKFFLNTNIFGDFT